MATTLEVEVVDMATTQDISLTASLGEYFSSSHFIVLYQIGRASCRERVFRAV